METHSILTLALAIFLSGTSAAPCFGCSCCCGPVEPQVEYTDHSSEERKDTRSPPFFANLFEGLRNTEAVASTVQETDADYSSATEGYPAQASNSTDLQQPAPQITQYPVHQPGLHPVYQPAYPPAFQPPYQSAHAPVHQPVYHPGYLPGSQPPAPAYHPAHHPVHPYYPGGFATPAPPPSGHQHWNHPPPNHVFKTTDQTVYDVYYN